jgi:hypothetical protein
MKTLGAPALPVVRAALEKLVEPLASEAPGAAELAEDLLLSVPPVLDEAFGHVVVGYVAVAEPNVTRAAARALPRVWGAEAAETLLALLVLDDDAVLAAALVGLREIDAVDRDVVDRIGTLFGEDRDVEARSPQLKAAAIAALGAAKEPARPDAAALLARLA